MKAGPTPRYLTLGIHPTSRGFGWVAFEGPFAPYDWATVGYQGDKNTSCLRSIERLLDRLKPETVVLEGFEHTASSRSKRIARLCRGIVALAADRGVGVAIYTRHDIRSAFRNVGARSRHEIAQAVIRHVDAFRHRFPKARQLWDSEDKRMSLFSAAALVLTHYAFGANELFEDLKGR